MVSPVIFMTNLPEWDTTFAARSKSLRRRVVGNAVVGITDALTSCLKVSNRKKAVTMA